MPKSYITYDLDSPHVIWGSGKTQKVSEKDARNNIEWYIAYKEKPLYIKTKTVPCDQSVILFADFHSGENVPWILENGIACLDPLKLKASKPKKDYAHR